MLSCLPKSRLARFSRNLLPCQQSVKVWSLDVYSGKLKNSGINSLTSPRISLEADSYAFLTSLCSGRQVVVRLGRKPFAREQPIRQIPISPLQCLEHVREGLKPNHEMANDHRRAEVCPIMERLLIDAFQVQVAGACSITPSVCQCTHRFRKTMNTIQFWAQNGGLTGLTLGMFPGTSNREYQTCSPG